MNVKPLFLKIQLGLIVSVLGTIIGILTFFGIDCARNGTDTSDFIELESLAGETFLIPRFSAISFEKISTIWLTSDPDPLRFDTENAIQLSFKKLEDLGQLEVDVPDNVAVGPYFLVFKTNKYTLLPHTLVLTIIGIGPPPTSTPRPPLTITEVPEPTQGLVPSNGEQASIIAGFAFNGENITAYTQRRPIFRLKERTSEQSCEDVKDRAWKNPFPNYDETTGKWSLTGLTAGFYCHLVNFDAAAPFNQEPNYPGDFSFGSGHGTEFSLQPGEIKMIDLKLHQFIHLTSPVDNSLNQIAVSTPVLEFLSPVQFNWEPVPGARIYELILRICRDALCEDGVTDARYTTLETRLEMPVAPSRNGQIYKMIFRAYDLIGDVVGKVWVRYGSLWHDGAHFRVVQ